MPLARLFVIGSSTTLLMDPYLERMLGGVFDYSRKGAEDDEMARALADLDTPRGASAGDTSMVLEYLGSLERAAAFEPDVVLLHVGLHDIRTDPETGRRQVDAERSRTNVERIVEWFADREIRLVWMRPGPLDEALHNARSSGFHRYEADLRDFNEAAEAVLARRGVPILDLAGFTARLGPMAELLEDHVHFTDDVVRQQAAYVAGWLSAR